MKTTFWPELFDDHCMTLYLQFCPQRLQMQVVPGQQDFRLKLQLRLCGVQICHLGTNGLMEYEWNKFKSFFGTNNISVCISTSTSSVSMSYPTFLERSEQVVWRVQICHLGTNGVIECPTLGHSTLCSVNLITVNPSPEHYFCLSLYIICVNEIPDFSREVSSGCVQYKSAI